MAASGSSTGGYNMYHRSGRPLQEPVSIAGSFESAAGTFFDDMQKVPRSHVGSLSSQWSSAEVPIILDGLIGDDGGNAESNMPHSSRASSEVHDILFHDTLSELQDGFSAVRIRQSVTRKSSGLQGEFPEARIRQSITRKSSGLQGELAPPSNQSTPVAQRRQSSRADITAHSQRRRPPPLVLESLKPEARPAHMRRGISYRSQRSPLSPPAALDKSQTATSSKPAKRERTDEDDEDTYTPPDLYDKAARFFDESYSMKSPSESRVMAVQEEFIAPHDTIVPKRSAASNLITERQKGHTHAQETSRSGYLQSYWSSDDLPNTPGLGQNLIDEQHNQRTPLDLATSLARPNHGAWQSELKYADNSSEDFDSQKQTKTQHVSAESYIPSSPPGWTVDGDARANLSGYVNPLLSGLPPHSSPSRAATPVTNGADKGSPASLTAGRRPSKAARLTASPSPSDGTRSPLTTLVFVSDSLNKEQGRKNRGRGLAAKIFSSPKRAAKEPVHPQDSLTSGMRALRRLSRRESKDVQIDMDPINASMLGITLHDTPRRDSDATVGWQLAAEQGAAISKKDVICSQPEPSRCQSSAHDFPSTGVSWAAVLEQGLCLHVAQGAKRVAWRMKYHSYDPFRRLEAAQSSRKRASVSFALSTLHGHHAGVHPNIEQSGVLEYETSIAEPLFSSSSSGDLPYAHEMARISLRHLTRGRDQQELLRHPVEIAWKNLGCHELFGNDKSGATVWRLVYSIEEGHRSRLANGTNEMIVENVQLLRPLRFSCTTSLLEIESEEADKSSLMSVGAETLTASLDSKSEEESILSLSEQEAFLREVERLPVRVRPLSGSFVEPPPRRRRHLSARVTSSPILLDNAPSGRRKGNGRCKTADGVVKIAEQGKAAAEDELEQDAADPTYRHLRRLTAAEAVKVAYEIEREVGDSAPRVSTSHALKLQPRSPQKQHVKNARSLQVSSARPTARPAASNHRSTRRPRTADGQNIPSGLNNTLKTGHRNLLADPHKAPMPLGLPAADGMRHLY